MAKLRADQVDVTIQALSAGYISGGALTDNLDGTIDIATGTGYIRESDSDDAEVRFITWPESLALSLTDNASNYVYVDYNSGSPIIAATISGVTIRQNENDKFELYEIYREGTDLHITQHRQFTVNALRRLQQRIYSINPIERANSVGGIILGETGTRNVTLSAGLLWTKLDSSNISAVDTSGADTFDRYYRDGGGGWTKQSAQTQWNNTQYDDGDGTLGTLITNRYSFQEFYIETDGHLVSVFGDAEYVSAAGAELSPRLATIPPRLDDHALYVGRIVFQESAATATDIISPFI